MIHGYKTHTYGSFPIQKESYTRTNQEEPIDFLKRGIIMYSYGIMATLITALKTHPMETGSNI